MLKKILSMFKSEEPVKEDNFLLDVLEQINYYKNHNKIILCSNIEDEKFSFYAIVADTILYFKKTRYSNLETFYFLVNESLIMTEQHIDIISFIKNNGSACEAEQAIDTINHNLKNCIVYYKFSKEEVSEIFKRIIQHNMILKNPHITHLSAIEQNANLYQWVD